MRLAVTHSRRISRGFIPHFILLLYCFHGFCIAFQLEKIGKQSSFICQNAYDVLCTISSASQRNSTLEVNLWRTRKYVSVLASRLQEARFIIGILEDALLSLLPPVPILPAPPLPPRPNVLMDPPALPVVPDPIAGLAEPLPPADPTPPPDPPWPLD